MNSRQTKLREREIEVIYHYTDANGKPFEVVRTKPKGFYQRQPNGKGGFINNLRGIKPTLYRLDEVKKAIKDGTEIFLVEGEKDVERLLGSGLISTTSPMGAGKWRDIYSEALRDADLIVIPDNDGPGYAHATKAATSCHGKAKRIRMLELPSECKDVSDWLDKGGTREGLEGLASQASEVDGVNEEPTVEKAAAQTPEPMVTAIPDGWEFAYIEVDKSWPVVQLRNISRNRSGHIVADLDAFCMEPGKMIPVTGVKFNLSSLQSQKQMEGRLKQSYVDVSAIWVDWRFILADLSYRAIKLFRSGDEAKTIWPSEEILKPGYLIEPLLPLHQPAIIFGDGSSGKGHLAITLGIIAQLPYKDNTLGLITLDDFSNVLYLDYESDEAEFQRTLTGICNGLGINVGLRRLGMSQPVADVIEQLRKRCSNDKVSFLVIDSLAPASGGNINEAEPAIKLYSALRTLPGVTTLIIAHNAKDTLSNKRSVYGSVFFTNLSRSVWEVKKSQDQGDPEMLLSLKHRKSNRQLHTSLGFKFIFDEAANTIKVERADLSDTSLSGDLPLGWQIKSFLKEGPATAKEIAGELAKAERTIASTLTRMARKEELVKLSGHRWGLRESTLFHEENQ